MIDFEEFRIAWVCGGLDQPSADPDLQPQEGASKTLNLYLDETFDDDELAAGFLIGYIT